MIIVGKFWNSNNFLLLSTTFNKLFKYKAMFVSGIVKQTFPIFLINIPNILTVSLPW